ncbi:hypothetical protein JVU11DRAFT_2547 [Chiua virens]|nr:hypothetical protein JVU11DRAFT_2547 [Chiua virens]
MPWRRDIKKELNIINTQCLQERQIFSPRGAKVTKHTYSSNLSLHPLLDGLSQLFYDIQWLGENPDVSSDEIFPWMYVATR